jgi:ABC-type polysaccharide/polyol phosphate export permease
MAIGWATAFKSIDPMQVIIGEFRDVFVYGKISYPLHYVETLLVTLILFLIVNRIFKRLTQNLAADV